MSTIFEIQRLMKNKEALVKFKVHQNVIIHYRPTAGVAYGHVTGFVLHPHPMHKGELLVRIAGATEGGETIQDYDVFHPDYDFEIL